MEFSNFQLDVMASYATKDFGNWRCLVVFFFFICFYLRFLMVFIFFLAIHFITLRGLRVISYHNSLFNGLLGHLVKPFLFVFVK